MAKMNDLLVTQQEELWEQYAEEQRNELRTEGQIEVCKMIKYELESKYSSSILFANPSEPGPTALREAIQIVEQYLP